ncbi:RNA polymerase II elongation factor, partial [Nowakowskiella sp. JEL0407]
MKSEIVELRNNLNKAVDALEKTKVSDILAILLTKTVDKELLKQSNLGKIVNNIRKIDSFPDDVKSLAKSVVEKWKKDINDSSSKPSPVSTSSPIPSVYESSSPSTPVSNKLSVSGSTSSNTVRSLATDKITYREYGIKARDYFIELLYKTLAGGSDLEGETIIRIVLKIEKCVNSANEGKDAQYQSRFRTIITSLKNNDALRESLLLEQLEPEKFAVMTKEEMAADHVKEKITGAEKLAVHNAQVAKGAMAETDIFQCGKCKKRKTTYTQKQTRSADEPM